MRDVKGRHNLITQGWTKLGTHARSRTSALKTTIVFFSGKFGFSVLPLSLQSVIYSCPCTSRFIESVVTTRTTTAMLAYNTQQSFLRFSLSGAVSDNLLHRSTLQFTTHVGSGFCIIVGYACTCLELGTTWAGFRECLCASRVYLVSTLDVTHVIKYTRLSPSLAGRAWERGYSVRM